MNLTGKLITSLVVAAVASTLTTLIREDTFLDPILLVAFSVATIVTALLVAPPARLTADKRSAAPPASTPAASRSAAPPERRDMGEGAPREQGTVKWFNVSKGFGFIVKDDGEEIFVHFRSIRGEGRQRLRDGQRVSFVVASSSKGPQAEDVEPLD
jgi:CspA family cold shock protein